MLIEFIRVIFIFKILIDVVIINSKERLNYIGVYLFLISDYYFIYVIRKIGIFRGRLRFVEVRNFKYFEELKFKMDFINAFWSCIDNF